MKWQEAGEKFLVENFHNLYSSPNIISVIAGCYNSKYEGSCCQGCCARLHGATKPEHNHLQILLG
jgi:hypothetical protein